MFTYLENLEYKKRILYEQFYTSTGQVNIHFSKYRDVNDKNGDRFYFRLYEEGLDDEIEIGYLYFYMHAKEKETKFIGLLINEKFRNQGYAEVLLSIWITFCLNMGLERIQTIDKQRKPFTLYLLKKFTFDVLDKNLYQTKRKIIDICRREDDMTKYLHFHDCNQEQGFRNSHIMREDNYELLSDSEFKEEDVLKLDQIFLLKPYLLQDKEIGYQKAKQIQKRYQ